MNELEQLKEKMEQRKLALKERVDRDYAGNIAGLNEAYREVKYWVEFIDRELLRRR